MAYCIDLVLLKLHRGPEKNTLRVIFHLKCSASVCWSHSCILVTMAIGIMGVAKLQHLLL